MPNREATEEEAHHAFTKAEVLLKQLRAEGLTADDAVAVLLAGLQLLHFAGPGELPADIEEAMLFVLGEMRKAHS